MSIHDEINLRKHALSSRQRAALQARISGGMTRTKPTIPSASKSDSIQLSFAQERIWLHEQLAPGSIVYNRPANIRLHGPLQIESLRLALNEVVVRHESLRTTVGGSAGTPILSIQTRLLVEIPFTDLSDENTPHQRARQISQEEARRPFNLAHDPPVRCHLLRIGCEEHLMVLTFHHLTFDAWSQAVLLEELTQGYAAYSTGTPLQIETPEIQYADFAAWDRSLPRIAALETGRDYWRTKLADPPVLQLPTDFPRPKSPTEEAGYVDVVLPAQLVSELRELARSEQTTLFSVLLAAFTTLLHRYTGDRDIVLGCPVSGRTSVEMEKSIGVFINTLPLRVEFTAFDTFRQLLPRIHDTVVSGLQHQEVPLQSIVEDVLTSRDMGSSPLFQAMFIHENLPLHPRTAGSVTFEPEETPAAATLVDLMLELTESGASVHGRFVFRHDLWAEATIERMVGHLLTLLTGIVQDADQQISECPLLTVPERHQLLVEWNDTDADYSTSATLVDLFTAQVARTPQATAARFVDSELTYMELEQRANQLANYLLAQGVEHGDLIGISMERVPEMVVGVLGILTAGAAYVPLDPAYPQARLAFMVQDAQLTYILTLQHLADQLPKGDARVLCLDRDWQQIGAADRTAPPVTSVPDDVAYVVYTSGSTGVPKGVTGLHQGTINRCHWMWHEYPFEAGEVCCQKTTLNFVDSVWEIFGPLLKGIPTLYVPDDVLKQPSALVALLARHDVSRIVLVPSLLSTLLDVYADLPQQLPSLHLWVTSGEALALDLAQQFERQMPDRLLLNLYGSSEVAADVTYFPVENSATRSSIPIGRPIANTQVYLLDSAREPVPVGVTGEIYIGGVGLAGGYLHRPDLTDERFLPHPFKEDARVYRTGDLGRYLADGNIEFLGRVDHQVKIRGYRIELGEIESVLATHHHVLETVVVARDEAPGGKRLVAYLVPSAGNQPSNAELRNYLHSTLPAFMIPATYITLTDLPLTPNGKIDRRALPAPHQAWVTPEEDHVAPTSPAEIALATIWAEALGVKQIGVYDNFFAIGGHSLLAVQIIVRIRRQFDVDISMQQIFDTPTIAALAEIVAPFIADESAPIEQKEATSERARLSISRHPRDTENFVLSPAQQRPWFLHELEPGLTVYNIPKAFRLQGNLDVAAFEQSLQEIVRRHESLRTTFKNDGGDPVQIVAPTLRLELPIVDLSVMLLDEQTTNVNLLLTEAARRPFDLRQGPLIRVMLIKLADDIHVFMFNMHHAITDGWSLGVFYHEIAQIYAAYSTGEDSPLAELPVQYVDFTYWQQAWLNSGAQAAQATYWRTVLDGSPPLLDLPTDFPRPSIQTYHGARIYRTLPKKLALGVSQLSEAHNVTPFMTLLAAFQTLLYRYTNQEDIVVGSPNAGRNQPEIEQTIGFFVNTLTLRTTFADAPTFSELLQRVRGVALGAFDHADYPFEQLVTELQPMRSRAYSPLFQVMFILQNTAEQLGLAIPDMQIHRWDIEHGTSKYDLTLEVAESEHGLKLRLEYNTALFTDATMMRLLEHFQILLESVVTDPDQHVSRLPLLTAHERQKLLIDWNDTGTDYPDSATLVDLFSAQVARTPTATAALFVDDELTYMELEQRANQLANYLLAQGVKHGDLIGISMERVPEMVVGVVGILKAGAAYVPLDPAYPQARLAFMVQDAQLTHILTLQHLADQLPKGDARVLCIDRDWQQIGAADRTAPPVTSVPDDVAYVVYTSGSTGVPKGVTGLHRGTINRCFWMWHEYPFEVGEVCCQKTTLNFVDSVWEIFGPLLQGVPTLYIPDDVLKQPSTLVALLARHNVTRTVLIPSLLGTLLDVYADLSQQLPSLHLWVTSGEALALDLAQQFERQMPDRLLLNLYGSSEVAADVTYFPVENSAARTSIPIGRPIANTQVYLLDSAREPVPVGVTGEIYIGGAGLAGGYLYRPDLTQKRFLPHPFKEGARVYRTGDLGRYLADGNIEFLGRSDSQVSLRGFRIELGEIEVALVTHPDVQAVVVMIRDDLSSGPHIVAYVKHGDDEVDKEQLRAYVRRQLPDYMTPSYFAILPDFPHTPNGKVDRLVLQKIDPALTDTEQAYVAPRTVLESQLVEIWESLLGKEPISVNDNFFDLGGHSLLAIRLLSHAKEISGHSLPVAALFDAPTIAELAQQLQPDTPTASKARIVKSDLPDWVIRFNETGTKQLLFHMGGSALLRNLAQYLGPDQPIIGVFEQDLDGKQPLFNTMDAVVNHCLQGVRSVQPHGPYMIGGLCFGGFVALEMARLLESMGESVELLFMVDAYLPGSVTSQDPIHIPGLRFGNNPDYYREVLREHGPSYFMKSAKRKLWRTSWTYLNQLYSAMGKTLPTRFRDVRMANNKIADKYHPESYQGSAVLVQVEERDPRFAYPPQMGWGDIIQGGIQLETVAGGHPSVYEEPYVKELAKILLQCLDE